MNYIASCIGIGITIAYSSTYSSYNNFDTSSMFVNIENFAYSMPSRIIEHNFNDIVFKNKKSIDNDNNEDDVIEIPVVKKMRFKFNKPTKMEFV